MDKTLSDAGQSSNLQNDAGTQVSYWLKSDTTGSGDVLAKPTKNPGAAGTATGADVSKTLDKSHGENTAKRGKSAMSKWAKDEHKRVARTVGYVLTIGTAEAWGGLTTVLLSRLTQPERVALAFSALQALDHDDAVETAQTALGGAGMPGAPLFGFLDQAAFWVDLAEPDEIEAYCLTCFNAMPKTRQAEFLHYATGRNAA